MAADASGSMWSLYTDVHGTVFLPLDCVLSILHAHSLSSNIGTQGVQELFFMKSQR